MTLLNNDQCKLSSINELIQLLETELPSCSDSHVLALLVVNLQRSDRIQGLLSPHYDSIVEQHVTERLRSSLRDKDRFIFATENECWFVLPHLSSEALAVLACHRILNALGTPLRIETQTVFFQPSIGIACAPLHAKSAVELLRIADVAQRNAESNNVRFELARVEQQRRSSPEDLPQALKEVLDNNAL